MVPVSFVVAAVLMVILLREIYDGDGRERNVFLLAFLGVLIFQLILTGTRFGYGVDWLLRIQPFTASLIGPLAYLSFAKPVLLVRSRIWSLSIHLLPLLVTVLAVIFARDLIDIAQGIFLLIYAALLLQLGIQGQDAIGWAELDRSINIYRSLWTVIGVLVLSAITDILVAFDFWTTGGANTAGIAGKGTLVAVGLFVLALLGVRYARVVYQRRKRQDRSDSTPVEQALLTRITQLLEVDQLHHDPDLSLSRLARKLGVPQRQVSEAINRQLGLSVSQFINNWRIDAVCEQLRSTDLPITQIMMNTGFNTKSNFNREFRRKLGVSPSVWRRTLSSQ